MFGEGWSKLHKILDMHVVIDAVKSASDGEIGEIEGQRQLASRYPGCRDWCV